MLFNRFEFLYFQAIVLVAYYLIPKASVQVSLLILASLYFYSAADVNLLPLLLFSIAFNCLCSWLALVQGSPAAWRAFGVLVNLSLLAYFKYSPLFLPENAAHPPLPIGISFFTFEGIMILFDNPPVRPTLREHLARTALLMSFFPHLVSGPIVKAKDFFPQITRKNLKDVDWNFAFRTLTVGYFLKMVVADNLRQQTNRLQFPQFQGYSSFHLASLLVGYSAQIFADFAGYSLIAIGLATLFGYRLPINFNYPYLSSSFTEFWRRWHITLSTFLRDYLYIPLGGNRFGTTRTCLNILIVMGLGGLWHGAAWSYAIWGLMHGAALVVERVTPRVHGFRWLKRFIVFSYVTLAWLMFRMPNFEHVQAFLKALAVNFDRDTDRLSTISVWAFVLPVALYHLKELGYPKWLKQRVYLAYGMMLFLILTNSGPAGDFIYFQF